MNIQRENNCQINDYNCLYFVGFSGVFAHGLRFNEIVISHLPDNLTIENGFLNNGCLDVRGMPIEKFPKNLKVGSDITLSGTLIKELPDNLCVNRNLYLSDTPLRELPKNLKVGGDLYLIRTPVGILPDDIKVGGTLYLRGSGIKKEGFVKPEGVNNVCFI